MCIYIVKLYMYNVYIIIHDLRLFYILYIIICYNVQISEIKLTERKMNVFQKILKRNNPALNGRVDNKKSK